MGDPVEGMVGYGSTVEIAINGGSYTGIDGLTELTPPPATVNNPESPQMALPNNTMLRISGKIITLGQSTFGLVWIPGSAADTLIHTALVSGARLSVRETFPNGASWTFEGFIAGVAPSTPLDDRMVTEVTIDPTGAIVRTAAAAPVNEVLPAISGVLEVGETLTAWPGIWSGGPTFAYQWENEGVAIEGATSQTYVVQAGDAGDAITVEITATNSEGSATATSAPVVIETP